MALWDTGAQVAILPREWVRRNMSESKVRDIHGLLRYVEVRQKLLS
jgi:hypothetical protein